MSTRPPPDRPAASATSPGSALGPGVQLGFLALGLAAFVLLRARWVGHLLYWDEALNLMTVRSFAAGVADPFAHWFDRHPPLYLLGLLPLSPEAPGFAERAQALSIALGVGGAIALWDLQRRVLGPGPALGAVFFLAVLPGAVLYDGWVKRDPAATLFALVALGQAARGRYLVAGGAIGLALLSKETALFPALVLGLGWAVERRRSWKLAAELAAGSVVVAGWWYAAHLSTVTEHLAFSQGAQAEWHEPWHFYLGRLPAELGGPGLLLALAGIAALVAHLRAAPRERAAAAWPVALLAVGYGLLSAAQAKVPWVVAGLLPAAAALQGLGAYSLFERGLRRWVGLGEARVAGAALVATAVVAAALGAAVADRSYGETLLAVAPFQARGAFASREAARALGEAAGPGDRALVTSFSHWGGQSSVPYPDAIFMYYVEPIPMTVAAWDAPPSSLLALVEARELDWALVSPAPGPPAEALEKAFGARLGAEPTRLPASLLYRASPAGPEAEKARENAGSTPADGLR